MKRHKGSGKRETGRAKNAETDGGAAFFAPRRPDRAPATRITERARGPDPPARGRDLIRPDQT